MKPSLLVLLLGATGCFATVATPQHVERSQFSGHALIQRSCAPWDGAAVELTLSPRELECGKARFPCITISIWKAPPEVSGKTFVVPNRKANIGAAVFSANEGSYDGVRSATVRFERFAPGAPARGEFDVELADGRRERGSFEAVWCEPGLPCG